MKTNKLMLTLACCATLAAACQKETNPVQEEQPINKSIVLNIANVNPATKGTGTTIANGTQITLNNYQVFFADAQGTFHTPKDATAAKDAETFFTYTADDDAPANPDAVHQFHFLPQSVTKVIVVGNNTTGAKLTAANYDALMTQVQALTIANQQDPTKLVLYGMDASLTAMTGSYTHEGQQSGTNGEDVHPEPLFKAEVNLRPAVARVEITGFEYSKVGDADRFFTEMTVENLSVINWYNNATVDLADDAIKVTASDQDTYFGGFYNDDTMYPQYLVPVKQGLPDAGVWYFDYLDNAATADVHEGAIPTAEPRLLGAKDVTDTGVNCWSYHFFPGALPRFIAELTGVNKVDGTDITTKLYLQTVALGNLTNVEAGKIYRMHFNFSDSDLRAAEKCIQVEITVAEWEVVPVTPTFGKYEEPAEETPAE